jgi:hypothetical protein
MAYLGNNPDIQNFQITVDRFNGTGACTQFTLTRDIDDAKYIDVLVNNVQQDPDNSYTVLNGVITFDEAPSVGTNNIIVIHRTGSILARAQVTAPDVTPNAITTSAIADSNVTTAKIANGAVTSAKLAANADAVITFSSGTYGNSSFIPTITVAANGRITGISNSAVSGIDAHPFVFTAIGT